MKLAIATDHNGVNEKQELMEYLRNEGVTVCDISTNNTPTDDYPDFALKVANMVVNGEVDKGILMCGTGIGMSIAANKVKGIRAAKVSNGEEARLAKEHNDANILCMSYKEPIEKLKSMSKIFIETPFSEDERHVRRINKIKEIEND